jgi:hypothetical protein
LTDEEQIRKGIERAEFVRKGMTSLLLSWDQERGSELTELGI